MAYPPKKPSHLHVRIPQDLKAQLEMQAAKEGVPFPDWIRIHLDEVRGTGRVTIEDDVAIPRYGGQNPNPYYPNPNPYQGYGYPTSPYPPYAPFYAAPPQFQSHDPMDATLNDMRKLVTLKMMKEILQAPPAPPDAYITALQGGQARKETFDWDAWQRYNMMSQEHERRMMTAQQQLELARSRGDKPGSDQAMATITQLMALQAQQSQTFLQQFMATQQANQLSQQTMFTTALQTQRQTEIDSRAQQGDMQQQIEGVRNQFWEAQMKSMDQMNQLHVSQLQTEMERIRTTPSTDPLAQLNKLLEMRNTSPIYKAAFDAAFGVKDETTLGKLIPQLKELGIDKLVERVAGYLGGLITRPKIPTPSPLTVPPPPPAASGIPPPSPITPSALEQLRLPPPPSPSATLTPTSSPSTLPAPAETKPQPQPPELVTVPAEEAVGYTNLNRPPEVIIEVPIETPPEVEIEVATTPETPETSETPSPSTPTEEEGPTTFTVGRKKGSKNKPKTEV